MCTWMEAVKNRGDEFPFPVPCSLFSDCFFPNSELRFLLLRLRQDAEVHNLTVTEVAAAAYDNDIARL